MCLRRSIGIVKHHSLLLVAALTLSTALAQTSAKTPAAQSDIKKDSLAGTPIPSPEKTAAAQPEFLLAFGKVTIADKEVETAIQWNTKTGEARMLNAASFADKGTGQQGNLIGWVPLVDLQQAVQNLAAQIEAKKQEAAPVTNATATPGKTP